MGRVSCPKTPTPGRAILMAGPRVRAVATPATELDYTRAVRRVSRGETLSSVATATALAVSTLHSRVAGRLQADGSRRKEFGAVGHPSRLSQADELLLVDVLNDAHLSLVPLSFAELTMHARELHAANIGCSEAALPVALFGKRWRAGWRKRMGKLGFQTSLRSVQDISAARVARLTPEMVDDMFPSWEGVLQTGNNGGAAGVAPGDAPQAKPGGQEVRCCRICGLPGHRADNKKVHPQGAQTPATQTAPEAV